MFNAIILCAGDSTRFFGKKVGNKNNELLNNKTSIINASLANFLNLEDIEKIYIVKNEHLNLTNITKSKKIIFVDGGSTRQLSVYKGLQHVKSEYVIIHDGARPFVSKSIIIKVMKAAIKFNSAVCAYSLTDTIKQMDNNQFVTKTKDRNSFIGIQTPQAFKTTIFRKAIKLAILNKDVNNYDDSQIIEKYSELKKIKVILNFSKNTKITYKEDLY